MNSVILNPQNYLNLNYFSDLKLTSVENFINQLLASKGLHRRKNLKEALMKIITTSAAYSKMGYQEIGISSLTFQKLLLCSKQTVFNFLSDIKNHLSDIVEVHVKLSPDGRLRNFFKVKQEALQQLSDLLTEEEHRQLEELLKQIGYEGTVEDAIKTIKEKENLSRKELKKFIRKRLKQKQQFLAYLKKLLLGDNITIETVIKEIEKTVGVKPENEEYIKFVYEKRKEGHNITTAVKKAIYKGLHPLNDYL